MSRATAKHHVLCFTAVWITNYGTGAGINWNEDKEKKLTQEIASNNWLWNGCNPEALKRIKKQSGR